MDIQLSKPALSVFLLGEEDKFTENIALSHVDFTHKHSPQLCHCPAPL